MAYVDIPSTADDQDSPLTESLAKAWTGNCIAIAQNDQTGDTPPIINTRALQSVGFSARKTAAVNINTTLTTIVFETEDHDLGSNYDNTTGVFTVGTGYAGLYSVSSTLKIVENNVDNSIPSISAFIRDGVTGILEAKSGQSFGTATDGLSSLTLSMSGFVLLSEGDTLDVQIQLSGGLSGDAQLSSISTFSATMLSRGTLT